MQAPVQRYNLKQLAALYLVSYRVLKRWLAKIPGLAQPTGRNYTPAEVRKIFAWLDPPDNMPEITGVKNDR